MDLEPAEKKPAELRRTAMILIAVMILGAVFVLYAYINHEKGKDPDRPPITAKITRNFAAKNQHDKLIGLYDLEGKVWFAVPVCVNQLDENKHALAMMKELVGHYGDREDVFFVWLSIDGIDQGVGPDQLAGVAEDLGVAESRCWLLTTGDTDKQRGYIKDQLRLGLVNARADGDPAGKWKFPSQLALIDRGMHIRQRYDFREAYRYQVKAEKELEKRPELADEDGFDRVLNAVEELKKTLYANTEFVLNETQTGRQ
ncbi:MAG: hypothetical protein KJO21_02705 [Verrucomicrobiae bacterium]|nr:hypothetical protein [Verrucomicrobiae bacterium]NNJ44210.1 hypothetical protein [Akkermansiaceae bacterium]